MSTPQPSVIERTVLQRICLLPVPDAQTNPRWVFAWMEHHALLRSAGKQMQVLCMRVVDGLVQDIDTRWCHAGDLREAHRVQFLEYLLFLCERLWQKKNGRQQMRWHTPPKSWYEQETTETVATHYFIDRKAQQLGRKVEA